MLLDNAPEKRSKIILVVDDEKAFLELVGSALTERGYEVYTATNGEEALDCIRDIRPDLILLDIRMPKMGGLNFYDRICLPNCQPMYPILVVSACENLEELFQNLPVEGFVTKPVKINELLEKIKSIFSKKGVENEVRADRSKSSAKNVLIIESDEAILSKIALGLLNAGYRVSAVKDAPSAVEIIINPELPNLILIRQGMPGQPEFTLSYHLRGMPEGRNVQIAVYTPNIKSLDPAIEKEIINFIGEKNLLESSDPGYLVQRCQALLEHKTLERKTV